MTALLCSYAKGMRPIGPDLGMDVYSPLDIRGDIAAVAHHEAGHTAAAYTLGFGCGLIHAVLRLRVIPGREPLATVLGAATMSRAIHRTIVRDAAYSPPIQVMRGIHTCAGPAAERKYRCEAGLPPNDQHQYREDCLDMGWHVGKLSERHRPETFRNVCWHLAQRFVDRPTIWAAIEALAEAVASQFDPPQMRDIARSVDIRRRVTGREATRILRESGLEPGMFHGLRYQPQELARPQPGSGAARLGGKFLPKR